MSAGAGGKEVVRAGRLLSGLTLVSRLLGLVRDVLMASLLGAGWVAGAFQLAWTVPNLFRRLLGEGALSSAFIPHFTASLQQEEPGRSRAFLGATLGVLGLTLVALVGVGLLVCYLLPFSAWQALHGAGNPVDAQAYAQHFKRLLVLLLPYLVPVCLLALLAGALQCRGRFGPPALAPVVLNLVWIAVLLVAGLGLGLEPLPLSLVLAGGILVGGGVQLLLQVPALRATDLLARPTLGLGDPRVRRVARDTVPVALGLAVFQVNALLDQLIAIRFVPLEGPNTYLFYANRLFQFPLALVGTAMAVASMPRLSALALEGEHLALRALLDRCTRLVLFLALPAAVGLGVLAGPAIELLFVRGRFTPVDGERTAAVLTCFALGLPWVCVTQLVTRVHYALGDRRRPLRIGLVLVAVNLTLNLVLVRPLGVAGLALATSATAILQTLWLLAGLPNLRVPRRDPAVAGALARMALLAAGMGGVVWGLREALAGTGPWLELLLPLAAGVLLYLGGARLLRLPELGALIR